MKIFIDLIFRPANTKEYYTKINQPSLSFSPTLHESNSVKESKKRILSPQKCIFFDFKQHSAAEVSQPKKFLKSSSTDEISKVLFQEKESILPTQKISTDAQKVSKKLSKLRHLLFQQLNFKESQFYLIL
jgi:hypothetical protein